MAQYRLRRSPSRRLSFDRLWMIPRAYGHAEHLGRLSTGSVEERHVLGFRIVNGRHTAQRVEDSKNENVMEKFELNVDGQGRGELALLVDGIKAGKMDVFIRGSVLTVYHTEVDQMHEGKGYAKQLLGELVRQARARELKIKPLCPYVHAQFTRHPDLYNDIWLKEQ